MKPKPSDCIHSYKYRDIYLCDTNDMICDEGDVEHCVRFTLREKSEEKEE